MGNQLSWLSELASAEPEPWDDAEARRLIRDAIGHAAGRQWSGGRLGAPRVTELDRHYTACDLPALRQACEAYKAAVDRLSSKG